MNFLGLFLIVSLDVSNPGIERSGLGNQDYEGVFWGAVSQVYLPTYLVCTYIVCILPTYNDTFENISRN